MKVVVITGSTRGIGYGLADAFLSKGCGVVINSRSEDAVVQTVRTLRDKYPHAHIWGQRCNVSHYASVQALWDDALAHFGQIDIWINNAGQSNPQIAIWEQDARQIESVINTNFLGAMYGAKVAIAGMLAQGHGALYNMLGLGSNGMKVNGMALYGSTKYAVKYFTDSLMKEVKGTNVIVGSISPGMVITDLLIGNTPNHYANKERMERIFNILGDRVETVTPWLAKKVLNNKKNGVNIAWLTKTKILKRFLAAPFSKRNILS